MNDQWRVTPGAPGLGRVRRWSGVLLLLGCMTAMLGGCEADTLYPGDDDGGSIGGGGTPRPSGAVGTVVQFPAGVTSASVGDLMFDHAGAKVFVSNRPAHQVEVLDLATRTFGNAIRVGSQPWGLSMNVTNDTLIVANSGGTNVSFVPTATLQEAVARRFEIPRITLYELKVKVDTIRGPQYTDILFFNYADRPQHIAQDARGRLLYSVGQTGAAPVGTIRVADLQPGWRTRDARLLFHERSLIQDSSAVAIANADTVYVVSATQVVLVDHVPGTVPQVKLRSPALPAGEAEAYLRERGSDVEVFEGARWRLTESIELTDTTFVASSADRRWIAFGEALRTPGGRIIMWGADSGDLSQVEDISDIVNNVSDRITGLGLNSDGSLGAAPGQRATYFFGNDLRLQGTSAHAAGLGAGLRGTPSGPRTLAFVGTARSSVQVVETTHYQAVAEVPIPATIVGPMRVAPPPAGSAACPADYQSGSPDCVIARIYGVTAQGVLILDVLRRYLP